MLGQVGVHRPPLNESVHLGRRNHNVGSAPLPLRTLTEVGAFELLSSPTT
jgi:hypothetical protein